MNDERNIPLLWRWQRHWRWEQFLSRVYYKYCALMELSLAGIPPKTAKNHPMCINILNNNDFCKTALAGQRWELSKRSRLTGRQFTSNKSYQKSKIKLDKIRRRRRLPLRSRAADCGLKCHIASIGDFHLRPVW